MRPKTLAAYLDTQIKAAAAGERVRPIIIRGAPGVGKSDNVNDAADRNGLAPKAGFEKLDLVVREPTDIGGLPYPSADHKSLDWLAPVWSTRLMEHYRKTSKPSIVFLDDLGAATQQVQIAALRLLLEDESGAAQIPPNTVKVAATNRASDKTLHYKMPAPLANRFKWITLEVHADDWSGGANGGGWAVEHGIHHAVIAFHRWSAGKYLYEKEPKADGPFATPRSWAFLSDELVVSEKFAKALANGGEDEARQYALELIQGTVGEAMGTAFYAYLKVYNDLVNVDDVLEGRVNSFPTEADQAYALCSSLAARYAQNPKKHAERIMDYAMTIRRKEFTVILVRDCINSLHKKPGGNPLLATKGFERFVQSFGRIVG